MIEDILRPTTEELLAKIDTALDTARNSLEDATSRYEAETAATRNLIEQLQAKREELAPTHVEVVEVAEVEETVEA